MYMYTYMYMYRLVRCSVEEPGSDPAAFLPNRRGEELDDDEAGLWVGVRVRVRVRG